MKFMLLLLALRHVAFAHLAPSLPVHPGGIGGLFKGPNSETIIKGPDGSIITAVVEGGEVHTKLDPIVVAEPAVAAVPTVAVAPLATPIEAVAVPAPVVEPEQSADLVGPSGRIVAQGSSSVVAGPASTTITGPAVVAETVVKGPPIVAAPILNSVAPAVVSVTPTPLVTVTGLPEIAPISVTAAPIAVSSLAPQAVVTASALPNLSIASATASQGSSVTAVAAPNRATASVEIAPVTAGIGPVIPSPSTIGPIQGPIQGLSGLGAIQGVEINGALSPSSTIAPGVVGSIAPSTIAPININDQIDLTNSQLIPDQLAIDNRQLVLNPAFVPPPIAVTPKTILNGRLQPPEILTTPGLGAVGTASTIQRGEAEGTIRLPPSTLQIDPKLALNQQQLLAIQNQQALLNNQIQAIQQNADARLATGNEVLLTPPADPRLVANGRGNGNLVQTQQLIANSNLARVQAQQLNPGIDLSQLQLTNVPLSSVSSALPGGIIRPAGLNDGLSKEAWGRYGRETKDKKPEKD